MLNVVDACNIIANKCRYIESIAELPNKYIITPLDDDGDEMDCPPYAIDKETGALNVYFPQKHFVEYLKAKSIPVPDKYRFD